MYTVAVSATTVDMLPLPPLMDDEEEVGFILKS
jgi:hypothetical protein